MFAPASAALHITNAGQGATQPRRTPTPSRPPHPPLLLPQAAHERLGLASSLPPSPRARFSRRVVPRGVSRRRRPVQGRRGSRRARFVGRRGRIGGDPARSGARVSFVRPSVRSHGRGDGGGAGGGLRREAPQRARVQAGAQARPLVRPVLSFVPSPIGRSIS